VHELDVLQMILASPIHGRRETFSHVLVRGQAELVEGGEEVIVSRSLVGRPVAHGPGIDELAIKYVIAVSAAHSGLGCVFLARIARRR
jgi:hypothetical protein